MAVCSVMSTLQKLSISSGPSIDDMVIFLWLDILLVSKWNLILSNFDSHVSRYNELIIRISFRYEYPNDKFVYTCRP
jgi:hypothetical protein